MNARHRKNLLKLAAYLESLPANYKHFDMGWFAEHKGDCDLPMDEEVYAAKEPLAFLSNCGTVACAVGHGPAAGVKVAPGEYRKRCGHLVGVDWHNYSHRVFGVSGDRGGGTFVFLFGGQWDEIDNHHYGAAARIRYFLDTDQTPPHWLSPVEKYEPYCKGSRTAKRREIDAALAGEAGTAATVKQGAVHEHATAQPERPNPTPILPKKERTSR